MYLIEDEEEIPKKSGNSRENNYSRTVTSKAVAIDPEALEAFKRAFHLVARHYQCPAKEIADMNALALANFAEATICYFALERQILGGAQGINERIRADIEKRKEGQ